MHKNKLPEIPSFLPVMVLSGVTLFPNALTPLFIFEPRYRVMLEKVLGTDRMLALAMPKDEQSDDLEEVVGAGLVRACIRNEDGTSNLILQGVGRVLLKGWEQEEPYRIARIQMLDGGDAGHDHASDPKEMELMKIRLHALCARFKDQGMELPPQFESYLNQIDDLGIITDLVASTLIIDPALRQKLLAELDVSKRLTMLLDGLRLQLS